MRAWRTLGGASQARATPAPAARDGLPAQYMASSLRIAAICNERTRWLLGVVSRRRKVASTIAAAWARDRAPVHAPHSGALAGGSSAGAPRTRQTALPNQPRWYGALSQCLCRFVDGHIQVGDRSLVGDAKVRKGSEQLTSAQNSRARIWVGPLASAIRSLL
jgi:hypothetical protein